MGHTHSAVRLFFPRGVRGAFFASALAALVIACSATHATPITQSDDGGAAADAGASGDGGAGSSDAAPGFDAANDPGDGPPMRRACTNTLGNAISTFHGRLDGYLVAIVPSTEHNCNSDSTHVHLQVLMGGSVYDVAVNVDGLEAQLPHAMVAGPWSEGWHTMGDGLDYPTALGIHSTAFATTSAQALMAALANVNHISVFATGYGPTGVHLVHRKGNGNDGAIVAHPTSATPYFFVFRFAADAF
jgi:hypothetical protein